MADTSVSIPFDRLVEQDHNWDIAGNTMTAGVASGATVDARSDGRGYWTASLNNIQFVDRIDALLWRAIRQLCNGGATPIVVPCRDDAFAPFPTDDTDLIATTFDDGTGFDDGTEFSDTVIDIICDAAALGATSLNITIHNAAPLQGGEKFSINHPTTFGWRLYEIATVTLTDSTHATITFNPPLREAVAAGTQLEFDQPRCTMKLVNAGSMDLNVKTWPFSLANVKFVELKYAI